ncbi:MAG: hypothetical protein IPK79_12495 [Vampirovibrionales bacterium]|nr:hypothetical protein [Vampirovibrionales bacterium]
MQISSSKPSTGRFSGYHALSPGVGLPKSDSDYILRCLIPPDRAESIASSPYFVVIPDWLDGCFERLKSLERGIAQRKVTTSDEVINRVAQAFTSLPGTLDEPNGIPEHLEAAFSIACQTFDRFLTRSNRRIKS